MTCYALIGVPGAGKTLEAVGRYILPALLKGRLVVTNVPLCIDKLSERVGFDVTALVKIYEKDEQGNLFFSLGAHFQQFDGWRSDGNSGHGPLFVVDECHKAFALLKGVDGEKHPVAVWLSEHRHVGADVVVMTQYRTAIPPPIRYRCEYTYEFKKLVALGFKRGYVRLMYHEDGKVPISTETGFYPKQWFGLYKSNRAGVVEMMPKVRNIFLSAKGIAIMVLLAVAVGVVLSLDVRIPGSGSRAAVVQGEAAKAEGKGGPAKLEPVQVGPEQPAQVSAEVVALRDRIEIKKLTAQLRTLESARIPTSGVLLPGTTNSVDGSSAVVWRAEDRARRTYYDDAEMMISGSMLQDAKRVYWLSVRRDGSETLIKDSELEAYGYSVHGATECLVMLRHVTGTYPVRCSGWAMVGDRQAVAPSAAAPTVIEQEFSPSEESRAAAEGVKPLLSDRP